MSKRTKMEKVSGNVFVDVGFPPEEALNLQMRAELMMKIEGHVEKSGVTQKQAAKTLGITQPRLNDLLKGRIDKFSLDALVNIATRAGMQVKMSVKKAA